MASAVGTIVEIGFTEYRIECIIGVYPQERSQAQPLFVDLWARYDASQAIQHDSETAALDYTELAEEILQIAVQGKFGLLETLVYECVSTLMTKHSEILSVSLTLRKPQGLGQSRGSRVRLTQTRS